MGNKNTIIYDYIIRIYYYATTVKYIFKYLTIQNKKQKSLSIQQNAVNIFFIFYLLLFNLTNFYDNK